MTRGVFKYCLNNIYDDGWKEIKKIDIGAVQKRAKARRGRKRRVAKYILNKVKQLIATSGQTIGNDFVEEDETVCSEDAWWTATIQSMCPEQY